MRGMLAGRWNNVQKLTLAYGLSTLYFYAPVGTLYLQSRGLSLLQVNSIWSIIVATMFLAEIPTGVLADRIGHKWAVVLALALQTLGEAIYLFASSYPLFVVCAIVGGLGFAFGSGCVEALVYNSLRQDHREEEMSRALGGIQAAQRLANLLAYTLGGFLVAQLTPARFRLAIALTAGAVGLGCLVTLTLRAPASPTDHAQRASPWRLVADGLSRLRSDRAFRRLALLSLATLPFFDYLGSLYQPHLRQARVAPQFLGLALAAASGINMLAARYAYWLERRLGTRWALTASTLLPGVLYLLFAPALPAGYAVLLFCLLYGSMGLRGPLLTAQLNQHIADHNRATTFSLLSMFSGLYIALWGPVLGFLGDRSTTLAFAVMGAVVLLGSWIWRLRRDDQTS